MKEKNINSPSTPCSDFFDGYSLVFDLVEAVGVDQSVCFGWDFNLILCTRDACHRKNTGLGERHFRP